MPLEIREMTIRAKVNESSASPSGSGGNMDSKNKKLDPDDPCLTAEEKEEMLKKIDEMNRQRKER